MTELMPAAEVAAVLPVDVAEQVGGAPHNNVAADSELAHLIDRMFRETVASSYLGKALVGPHIGQLHKVHEPIAEQLCEIDPGLTPEYLASRLYYTSDMLTYTLDSPARDIEWRIERLRKGRESSLRRLVGESLGPAMESQTIAEGLLTRPPYSSQVDPSNRDSPASNQGCANACFRMVCADLLGTMVPAGVVGKACLTYFNSHLVRNHNYLNLFHSPALAEACGRAITTLDILGADLGTIEQIATKAQQKWPGSSVYCMTPLASESDVVGITHQSVLLDANGEVVHCQDPSQIRGKENRELSKRRFVERWAMGLNEAMIVVAR